MKSAVGQGFMRLGSRCGEVGYFVVRFDCEGCEYSYLRYHAILLVMVMSMLWRFMVHHRQ